ncbi:TonB family protein [Altererythrobacter soli]|uniref:TonB family protein n=1 Tax=Croceibacterium soli TaxID=1739690 RepID=A0A6I4URV2_9SPHN|nr:energy transducer TonB [Croceibacterium soli]MXP41632.1 TonB family protein [Croceibacterium soli]
MIARAASSPEAVRWGGAAAAVFAAHAAVVALALTWARAPEVREPEPVVMLELPPLAAAEAASEPQPTADPVEPAVQPTQQPSPIDLPQPRAPLPQDAVRLPPPAPAPVAPRPAPQTVAAAAPAQPAAQAPARAQASEGQEDSPGDSAQAKRQQQDYYAKVMAHLAKRKVYPPEAKKARQQGVVTVRFTVDRNGGISGASVRKSSGYELLDGVTLELLSRAAPLPRMPSSMRQDSVTLSLPIEYSLRTD